MGRNRIHERVGKRYFLTMLLVIASGFFSVAVWFVWMFVTAFPGERTTVITSVDPVEIRSWDQKRKLLTIFSLSEDVRVEGVFGVGTLPVASLARLEAMDKTKKGLLAKSLGNALGTPISEGELPPLLRLRFFLTIRAIRPDAVKRIDLASLGAYRLETLPDGSSAKTFDMNRFDAVIGAALEVDSIRREGLRVRVVNTMDVAGLGNRAARMLSHAGMVVVAVESEPTAQKRCSVHAKKELWDSQTSRFIQNAFACTRTDEDRDERADLTIRLTLPR